VGLLLAAGLISFMLHGALGTLCLLGAKPAEEDKTSLFIQLISHRVLTAQTEEPERPSTRKSARQDAPSAAPGQEQAVGREAGSRVDIKSKPAATPLSEPVQDEATRNALKRIQKKIIPHWNTADPPGIGLVEIRMELDGRGAIRSLWITSLQGPPELGDFIAGLIKRSSPFPEAVRHVPGQTLVLDCAFNVTGSTMRATAARSEGG